MERHFREFVPKQPSPGLILNPQKRVDIGRAIADLVLRWEGLEPTQANAGLMEEF